MRWVRVHEKEGTKIKLEREGRGGRSSCTYQSRFIMRECLRIMLNSIWIHFRVRKMCIVFACLRCELRGKPSESWTIIASQRRFFELKEIYPFFCLNGSRIFRTNSTLREIIILKFSIPRWKYPLKKICAFELYFGTLYVYLIMFSTYIYPRFSTSISWCISTWVILPVYVTSSSLFSLSYSP